MSEHKLTEELKEARASLVSLNKKNEELNFPNDD